MTIAAAWIAPSFIGAGTGIGRDVGEASDYVVTAVVYGKHGFASIASGHGSEAGAGAMAGRLPRALRHARGDATRLPIMRDHAPTAE